MARRARGVRQRFELSFLVFFRGLCSADLVKLLDGEVDGTGFAEDRDFEEARIYGARVVGNLLELHRSRCQRTPSTTTAKTWSHPHKIIGLPYFIRRLLQPSLRSIDSPIAFIDIFLHIAHIVVLEPQLALLGRAFIFLFQRFAVHLWTGAKVLFRICE